MCLMVHEKVFERCWQQRFCLQWLDVRQYHSISFSKDKLALVRLLMMGLAWDDRPFLFH